MSSTSWNRARSTPWPGGWRTQRWRWSRAAAVENASFLWGELRSTSALRDGLDPQPAGDPDFRRRLEGEVQQSGTGPLHDRLLAVDPVAAARIHPHDARRIIRALEVVEATGRPLPSSWGSPRPVHRVFAHQMMILDQPRRTLRERIDRRVEQMFAEGLVEEARVASVGVGGLGATARQAAGYAEALGLLAGRLTLAQAVQITQQRTRQLAKRQLTWLRSFQTAVWIGA